MEIYVGIRSWYSTVFCMRNSSLLYTSDFPLFARLIEGGREGCRVRRTRLDVETKMGQC